ncbi:unnamed protein product [Clonostachys solani]|uniref:Uncharacterized protein n=1 Tax=Clonostachys solani TaxID=160281 RepID=A0A9N9ZLU2_9HYPO|nr:unnamed protein product [Clonostachys solani]
MDPSGDTRPSKPDKLSPINESASSAQHEATNTEIQAIASCLDSPPQKRKRRAAVVGLGMVGVAFVEKLLNYDAMSGHNEWEVSIFGEEPYLAYNRVGLTQYFNDRSIKNLYLNPPDWYSSFGGNKLAFHTSDAVTAINPEAKSLRTAKGDEVAYDVCILATGSNAALPPFLPLKTFRQTKGSFVYRTIQDLDAIMEYVVSAPKTLGRRISKVGVIGGGVLGLEAAKGLLDLGAFNEVVLIEGDKWLLSRQLDEEGGKIVGEKIKAMGVQVHVGARVQSLLWDDKQRLSGLVLQGKGNGQKIGLDMLVFAVGVRARDELCRNTPIAVGKRPGGFIVDPQLRTNVPGVYAIGDCANYQGQNYGLIAPGIEMAEVLAFNLTKEPHHRARELQTPDLSTKLKLMGVDVAAFGDYFADQGIISKPLPGAVRRAVAKAGGTITQDNIKTEVKAVTYRDPFLDVYRKYIFSADGKYILGGMMVGDVKDYSKLLSLYRKGEPIDKSPSEFFGGKKSEEDEDNDLPDDAQVCSCHNVTKGEITQCVKDGKRSFDEVQAATKCSTGCGGCESQASRIFDQALAAAGLDVANIICKDFPYSRKDLMKIIKTKELKDFRAVMETVGNKPNSFGCMLCRPAIASLLSEIYNDDRYILATKKEKLPPWSARKPHPHL